MTGETRTPIGFALLLFGFALAVIGAELVITEAAFGALAFALLVAGLATGIGGGWALARGEMGIGTALSAYGLWLSGAFLLVTVGRALGLLSPVALAAYFLAFLPVAVLVALPAFRDGRGRLLQGAFAALVLWVAANGVQFLVETPVTETTAGVLAWASALLLWMVALRRDK